MAPGAILQHGPRLILISTDVAPPHTIDLFACAFFFFFFSLKVQIALETMPPLLGTSYWVSTYWGFWNVTEDKLKDNQ
jgi:hypothetical protein